ncbi:MAG TPA: hypothetical protein VFZ96_00015 [Actinomycetota bacterium]|nr:hypothetical protein [Actinomycetota bacterium]
MPSIEYTVIDDREEELFNPIRVQVDVFAEDEAQCALLERTVRRLTHRDTARDLGGYRMWTRFLDARSHPYAHDPECVHRSTDFEFVPLRERYATP